MFDFDTLVVLVMFVSLVLFSLGAWKFHQQVRTKSSSWFAYSALALVLLVPVSIVTNAIVIFSYEAGRNKDLMSLVVFFTEEVAVFVLIFLISTSFFFAVRSSPWSRTTDDK